MEQWLHASVVLEKLFLTLVRNYSFFFEHVGELRIFILRRRNAQNRQVQTAKDGNTGILHET
jgi:hypothetical protein